MKSNGNLQYTGVERAAVTGTPYAQELRPAVDKWDLIKPKSPSQLGSKPIEYRRSPQKQERKFSSYTSRI